VAVALGGQRPAAAAVFEDCGVVAVPAAMKPRMAWLHLIQGLILL